MLLWHPGNNNVNIPNITKDSDLSKLTIKDGDKTLKPGTDYDITQSMIGNTVTITFKGNYSGAVTKSVQTIPVAPVVVKAVNSTAKANRLRWNRVKGADGYTIYGALCKTPKKSYKLKEIRDISSGSTTTFLHKGLKKKRLRFH